MNDKSGLALNNRDLGTKAAKDLCELQTHIVATDDHKMFGQLLQLQDRRIREIGHIVNTGYLRHVGTRANVKKDLFCLQHLAVNGDGVRTTKPRGPTYESAMLHPVQPPFQAPPGLADNGILPALHSCQVHR